jgi:hypothetical protein
MTDQKDLRERLQWLNTPERHGGGSPLRCLRSHLAGNQNAKSLVRRDVLLALIAVADEALAALSPAPSVEPKCRCEPNYGFTCRACEDEAAAARLEASGERPVAPSGWQPIASAPKDGRDVLLLGGSGSGRWRRVGYWARRIERWSVDAVVELSEPAAWLPLPPTGPDTGGQS